MMQHKPIIVNQPSEEARKNVQRLLAKFNIEVSMRKKLQQKEKEGTAS